MGGVGKTQLAREAARRLRDDFPGGQVLVDMAGTPSRTAPDRQPLGRDAAMAAVLRGLLGAGASLPEGEALAGLYQSTLRDRPLLLLFDDARNAAQVQGLLPGPPAGVLVTSRTQMALAGALAVPLDAMTPKEALDLLRHMLQGADEGELGELAGACGRLPLALRFAGGFLAETGGSVGHYLKRLREARLACLKHSARAMENDELDVAATLSVSFEQLLAADPDLAAQWQRLSVFPAGFDADAAAAVLGMAAEDAEEALGLLSQRSLVGREATKEEAKAPARFRLHDLLRDLAWAGLDDVAREEAGRRHVEYYVRVMGRCGNLYRRDAAGVLEGLALYDRERANIDAGQAWAAARIDASDSAARLVTNHSYYGAHVLALRYTQRERIPSLKATVRACRKLGNRHRRQEGLSLGNIGGAYRHLGNLSKAITYSKQALKIAREVNDRNGESKALAILGMVSENRNNLPLAVVSQFEI
ncbi:MAG: hypothetical protein KDG89_03520, partial [Geminicoccaceae bacterium]|nr:hypothetical protein [Geminicoccaceae bacterium]